METLKLLLIFAVIVIALKKNVSVGISLFFAGLLMALLFDVPFTDLTQGYLDLVKSQTFIMLTLVVIFITYLGSLLKELGFLERLSVAVQGLPGGSKTAVAALPPLIGMMPMPGGSLMSAPLVDNVLKNKNHSPEFKLVVNYWFRHLAEFFWPLYAGVILSEAITGLPMLQVSMMQFPLSIGMATIGYFIYIRKIQNNSQKNGSLFVSLYRVLTPLWSILLSIFLYGVLKVDLSLSVLISSILLMVITRPSTEIIKKSLKRAFAPNLIFLVCGVLSFQMVIELAHAVDFIPELATTYNFPKEFVVFLVPFTIGILTGMVSAYVGLGYTILAGFLYQNGLNPGLMMIAYLSGFVGVMLSPSHLCLILTNEYFGSDLMKVYKRLIPLVLLLMTAGIILYLIGWGDLFAG